MADNIKPNRARRNFTASDNRKVNMEFLVPPLKLFSPMQRRIIALLNDGDDHSLEDLKRCLDDPLLNDGNVYNHIIALRRVLQGYDLELVSTIKQRRSLYRLAFSYKPVFFTEDEIESRK